MKNDGRGAHHQTPRPSEEIAVNVATSTVKCSTRWTAGGVKNGRGGEADRRYESTMARKTAATTSGG